MQASLAVAPPRRRISVRLIVGLILTGLSLFLLFFPGDMLLPIFDIPVMPRMGGCANFLGPVIFLFFLLLGVVVSIALIIVGIVAIVLTATKVRGGLTMAVVVDAVIASLLLMPSLGELNYGATDSGQLGTAAVTAVFAVIPLAATVLLLARSQYRSRHSFVAALVATCLVLAPGGVGVAVLALELGGVIQAPSGSSTVQTTANRPAC